MALYNGPKCRLCRREKTKLFLKGERCFSTKCPIEKKAGAVPPGQHGKRFSRRPSVYCLQLREKQKIKRIYGVLERQFRRYFSKASKAKGQTGVRLLQILEMRLDRVIYLAKIINSKKKARQYITHGHVLVNGKKVTIPSYIVKKDDVITLKENILKNPEIQKYLSKKVEDIPLWLKRGGPIVKVIRVPKREDIDLSLNEQLVVEFYSR